MITYNGKANIKTLTLLNTTLGTFNADLLTKQIELEMGDIDIVDLQFISKPNGHRFDVLVLYTKYPTNKDSKEVIIIHD